MGINDFEFLNKLGEGSYSTVYKVKRKVDNQIYALKKIKFGSMSSRDKQNALNEIRILASINHPNIVSYKEAFIDEGTSTLCLIMDFAEQGDLLQQIQNHKKNNTYFSEQEIWDILYQSTTGLKLLHDMKILHRDIKSANIFLSSESAVKLGDLNVSKIVNGLAYTQTGTPYYASPEIWKDLPYDSKSDIWSLGCVIYELAALEPPFKSADMKGLYRKVTSGKIPRLPDNYSSDLNLIIKCMLQVKPSSRPSCEQLLEMPAVSRNIHIRNDVEIIENNGMLETIRLPPSLRALKAKLPGPNYDGKKRNQSARRRDDVENYGKVGSEKNLNSVMTPSPILRASLKAKPTDRNIFKDRQALQELNPNTPKLPPMHRASSLNNR
ncbi:unnamed protein product [Blepharisma stoltei]|uniref:non-specific serine/threonine protein kinase n=1 Tax=Blepharisma stoltei TaxID=1481888 RepID=A0AAU9JJ70_9CILI|nr:unnamed protein product [Blepharisma stoltei]